MKRNDLRKPALVLILSTSDNQHANSIQVELENNGVGFFRFDFDLKNHSSVGFHSGQNEEALINGNLVQVAEVSGVFVHHPLPASLKFTGSDLMDSSLIASGWRNAIDWFEEVFSASVWINKPSNSRVAASVLLQLNVAASCGMSVPKTLFTTDLELLKLLANQHGKIVIKSGPLLGVNLDGHRLLTHVIDVGKISREQLAASPCLFQEYVEKAFELRIHVIGDVVYACRIDSQRTPHTKIDWRNYRLAETPHSIFKLDEGLADKCRAITKQLGLTLGILDVIVTPDGRMVFLECNSQGHWLWIEELVGIPITPTIVRALRGER